MNKVFFKIIFSILFFLAKLNNSTAQEWSFGAELGATVFSFFQYTPKHLSGNSFSRGYDIPHNEGWILSYYPSNRKSFFSMNYNRFHPRFVDAIVRYEDGSLRTQHISGTFDQIISLNIGHQFDIGKCLGLENEKLFLGPLYGIGMELLNGGSPYPVSGVINLENYSIKLGINPSLQLGFRLFYRYRRSKFSVKALGNLGLRYHTETEYRILLSEKPILATFRSKSDFIAVQASYEYVFKSKKVEKKMRRRDIIASFSRNKKQELKIGIHPFEFARNVSLSYELLPAKHYKSIVFDLTYFNNQYKLGVNVSEDEYNPKYVLSTFKEPYLDMRIGRNLFSDKKKGEKWGVGYYLRMETRLSRSRKLITAFQQLYDVELDKVVSYYAALGANLQYKWLIKDRWSITPMILTDLGIGNGGARITKYPLLFDPFFADAQARLYVGYRF